MNRYGRGGSKASSTTLCQKCLKRGSYECKTGAQERPYQSRPSRTQQLLNPRLAPKLTNSAPEPVLPTKRATEQQQSGEKNAGQRPRERSLDDISTARGARKRSRSRSVSSYSSASVSTISTRSSPSSSSPPRRAHVSDRARHPTYQSTEQVHAQEREKRRRRAISVSSSEARSFDEIERAGAENERRTRPRRRSTSPGERGRRHSRSVRSDRASLRSLAERASTGDSMTAGHGEVPAAEDQTYDSRSQRYSRSRDRALRDAVILDSDKSPSSGPNKTRQRSLSPYSKRKVLLG